MEIGDFKSWQIVLAGSLTDVHNGDKDAILPKSILKNWTSVVSIFLKNRWQPKNQKLFNFSARESNIERKGFKKVSLNHHHIGSTQLQSAPWNPLERLSNCSESVNTQCFSNWIRYSGCEHYRRTAFKKCAEKMFDYWKPHLMLCEQQYCSLAIILLPLVWHFPQENNQFGRKNNKIQWRSQNFVAQEHASKPKKTNFDKLHCFRNDYIYDRRLFQELIYIFLNHFAGKKRASKSPIHQNGVENIFSVWSSFLRL